jgi:hypothetical protein
MTAMRDAFISQRQQTVDTSDQDTGRGCAKSDRNTIWICTVISRILDLRDQLQQSHVLL